MAEWTYDGADPGIQLFTAALAGGAVVPILPDTALLEVGCLESDWLARAHAAWPDTLMLGVDWRAKETPEPVVRVKANALDRGVFPAGSFRTIVSLSAIEHFGLGHYAHDPLDPDGDSHILANCWHWLQPGGTLYFDVPYDPTGFRVEGTGFRAYDDVALRRRLFETGQWVDRWRGYVNWRACTALLPKPTSHPPKPLAYYVACVWEKPA